MSSYKVLALISGGKDSCYSMIQCVSSGHEIVGLANLRPNDEQAHELDSYMYQTVGHTAISLYAEAMNLPLFRGSIKRTSLANTSNDYSPTEGDEVEDLYDLLAQVKTKLDFNAVCSGAILSDYQRIRVENVCARLGLVSLGFLWRRDQTELLDEMLDCGKLEAIIVKVATLGLDQSHLGKTLAEIRPHLHKMNLKYGINVCGEGGEYETFTLDCPLFYKALQLEDSQMILHSDDAFAPVAFLKLKSIKLRDKKIGPFSSQSEMLAAGGVIFKTPEHFAELTLSQKLEEDEGKASQVPLMDLKQFSSLVQNSESIQFDKKSGFFSIGNLHGSSLEPVEATNQVFAKLNELLSSEGATFKDLSSVTMLIGDMSQYAQINSEYVQHFESNPPVRVCVQAPIAFPVVLSAIGHLDHAEKSDQDCCRDEVKKVMHVQSVSHWAPANIGPYSQVVQVGGLVFVAGQIGLIPGSMVMAHGFENQARLGFRHLARALEVFSCSVKDIVQVVCFIVGDNFSQARDIWIKEQNESGLSLQFLCVKVPRLPRDALVEWQVLASQKQKDVFFSTASEKGMTLEQTRITTSELSTTFISAQLRKTGASVKLEDEGSAIEDFLVKSLQEIGSISKGILQVYFKTNFSCFKMLKETMQTTFIPVSQFSDANILLAWTVLIPTTDC